MAERMVGTGRKILLWEWVAVRVNLSCAFIEDQDPGGRLQGCPTTLVLNLDTTTAVQHALEDLHSLTRLHQCDRRLPRFRRVVLNFAEDWRHDESHRCLGSRW